MSQQAHNMSSRTMPGVAPSAPAPAATTHGSGDGGGGDGGPAFSVDWRDCLVKGVAAAAGTVPGTVFAHPADVVKIRIQTTSGANFPRTTSAVHGLTRGSRVRWFGAPPASGSQQLAEAVRTVAPLFDGLFPAVMQKVATRGLMFLAAEVSVQSLQSLTPLSSTQAHFAGAMLSGYATGSAAAIWEYGKVLQSQGNMTWRQQRGSGGGRRRGGASPLAIVQAAVRSGNGRSVLRRLHAAGIRNGVFDSCFFGTQHLLSRYTDIAASMTYGMAAIAAVVLNYTVDVSVKRMMLVAPDRPVQTLQDSWRALLRSTAGGSVLYQVMRVHAGVMMKGVELCASFLVMGSVGAYVTAQLGAYLHPPQSADPAAAADE